MEHDGEATKPLALQIHKPSQCNAIFFYLADFLQRARLHYISRSFLQLYTARSTKFQGYPSFLPAVLSGNNVKVLFFPIVSGRAACHLSSSMVMPRSRATVSK